MTRLNTIGGNEVKLKYIEVTGKKRELIEQHRQTAKGSRFMKKQEIGKAIRLDPTWKIWSEWLAVSGDPKAAIKVHECYLLFESHDTEGWDRKVYAHLKLKQ
eukprot:Protomagalhaensia_wolfi_Nauph_80__6197@NODE_920_length_1884_cov_6_009214_g692_i0_p2_GENE_NODE_920_length_1884_cov_6_009214_g692_i0NODE_920_length_1884_cov_6_009214_g692_i0_p2_ORF_typecomplete_len102_score5_89_NODE_920_length_1884_cov_6_009214_g692_i010561361